MNVRSAVEAIEKHGILLVYPVENRKEPLSLWSAFFPRSRMRWEWDEEGDDRVSRLWHLREELSRSGKVVYSKWYRGRATFFSKEIFTGLLAALGTSRMPRQGLSPAAREILEVLSLDSPLSTRQIKRATDLIGRANEAAYHRAMNELSSRLLIVGFGEVDEGAFPSLASGATELLFEDLWSASRGMEPDLALKSVRDRLGETNPFLKQLLRVQGSLGSGTRPPAALRT